MLVMIDRNTRWVKAALKKAKLTQAALAHELSHKLNRKIHKQTVQNMTQGKRRIQVDELIAIAEITGYQLPPKSDALVGGLTHQGREELDMSAARADWMVPLIRALEFRGAEPMIVEILGDAGFDPAAPQAEGSLRPGDHVVVDRADKNPTSPGPFLVHGSNDPDHVEAMFVRFLEIIEDGIVKMSSKNPLYEPVKKPLAEANIVGRVRARISITRM